MELDYFCDEYIIANYQLYKKALEQMPRYSDGIRSGRQCIRVYTGVMDSRRKHEHFTDSPEGQKIITMRNQRLIVEKLFDDFSRELERRKVQMPSGFRVRPSKTEFTKEVWSAMKGNDNSFPVDSEYYDDRNNQVKSRSEMIIGNVLDELGIPYKYEPQLQLASNAKIYPDFVPLINVLNRFFYIEFMGKTDDYQYMGNNVNRIENYLMNGIHPHRDLIIITGTKNWIPTRDEIKRIIVSFINNLVISACD